MINNIEKGRDIYILYTYNMKMEEKREKEEETKLMGLCREI